MKKTIVLLLALLMLAALAACGKTEAPKEDNKLGTSVDDKKPEDNETSEDNSVSFESGRLPTMADSFYEDLTYDNYSERMDEIQHLIVNVVETREQCEALIHPKYYEFLEEINDVESLQGKTETMYDTINKYTADFLSEKQVIAITYIGRHSCGDEPVVKELIRNEDGTYSVVIAMDYYFTFTDITEVPCFTVTIEVDRTLGITPENLTVEFVQGNLLE